MGEASLPELPAVDPVDADEDGGEGEFGEQRMDAAAYGRGGVTADGGCEQDDELLGEFVAAAQVVVRDDEARREGGDEEGSAEGAGGGWPDIRAGARRRGWWR